MYLYFVAVLLFSSLVAADTCGPLNATFNNPRVCYPTYSIPSSQASNNTGGDLISQFFKDNKTPISEKCAEAFSAYYCGLYYPQCDTNNATLPACNNTCNNVVTACANDNATAFANSSFTLPTNDSCNTLTATPCTATPTTNLTSYYAECAAFNVSLLPKQNQLVCTPPYLILSNASYQRSDDIFETLGIWSQNAYPDPTETISTSDYPCLKAIANYWCSAAFPECPSDGVLPVLPVCQSVCSKILDLCGDNITQNFPQGTPSFTLILPTKAECNALPNKTDVDCFVPPANSTTLEFFYACDPPQDCPVSPPTTAPTPAPEPYDGIVYPPGGPGKGGAIGAAVLIGLLGIIGLLMLLMKKQDSR